MQLSAGIPDRLARDVVQPFQLEHGRFRGRAVRLGPALDRILGAHDYPRPIANLLAEALVHTVLLSAMLKYDGIFTFQIKGNGAVSLLICDITTAGDLRGYVQYDPDLIAQLSDVVDEAPGIAARSLLGEGYLAFTVDQGVDTDRYQGIVELSGTTLTEAVQHYFRQSEQIVTGIRLAVDRRADGWQAGAIMLQRLPEQMAEAAVGSAVEDDWRRDMLLLDTCTDVELLDPALDIRSVLYRLFHEDGVRVFDPTEIRRGCRCTVDRIERMLASLPVQSLDELKVDGVISVTCEFCNQSYVFNDRAISRLQELAGGHEHGNDAT